MRYTSVPVGLILLLMLPAVLSAAPGPRTGRGDAQGNPQNADDPAPEVAGAATQPDRRRLLRLADGRTLRVRSRAQNGVWEVRRGPTWEVLGGEVVAQRLERELTAEAREKLAQARDDDALLAFATWAQDEGLQAEALVALNRVLAGARNHPGALAWIAGRRIELELEDAGAELSRERLLALLDAGARGPAAESEVAVRRLAEFEGRTPLRRLVEVELAHPNAHHRAFAVLMAQRLFPADLLTQLTDRALLDRYEDVRRPAAQALGNAGEVAVLAPMIRALASQHAPLRLHAVQAMAHMGYAAAVEPLVVHLAFLQDAGGAPVGTRASLYIGQQTAIVGDYDVEIAQAASIADPIVGVVESGVVLDVRAVAQITRTIEQQAVLSSLRELTGEAGPSSAREWLAWWEREQGRWRSLDRAAGR